MKEAKRYKLEERRQEKVELTRDRCIAAASR